MAYVPFDSRQGLGDNLIKTGIQASGATVAATAAATAVLGPVGFAAAPLISSLTNSVSKLVSGLFGKSKPSAAALANNFSQGWVMAIQGIPHSANFKQEAGKNGTRQQAEREGDALGNQNLADAKAAAAAAVAAGKSANEIAQATAACFQIPSNPDNRWKVEAVTPIVQGVISKILSDLNPQYQAVQAQIGQIQIAQTPASAPSGEVLNPVVPVQAPGFTDRVGPSQVNTGTSAGNPYLTYSEAQLEAEKASVDAAISYRQSQGLSADYQDMTLIQLMEKRALIMAALTPMLVKKYGLYAAGGVGALLVLKMLLRPSVR